jgi:hypothetical protein
MSGVGCNLSSKMDPMDHDQSIPEQLSFFDLLEGPGVAPNHQLWPLTSVI